MSKDEVRARFEELNPVAAGLYIDSDEHGKFNTYSDHLWQVKWTGYQQGLAQAPVVPDKVSYERGVYDTASSGSAYDEGHTDGFNDCIDLMLNAK